MAMVKDSRELKQKSPNLSSGFDHLEARTNFDNGSLTGSAGERNFIAQNDRMQRSGDIAQMLLQGAWNT